MRNSAAFDREHHQQSRRRLAPHEIRPRDEAVLQRPAVGDARIVDDEPRSPSTYSVRRYAMRYGSVVHAIRAKRNESSTAASHGIIGYVPQPSSGWRRGPCSAAYQTQSENVPTATKQIADVQRAAARDRRTAKLIAINGMNTVGQASSHSAAVVAPIHRSIVVEDRPPDRAIANSSVTSDTVVSPTLLHHNTCRTGPPSAPRRARFRGEGRLDVLIRVDRVVHDDCARLIGLAGGRVDISHIRFDHALTETSKSSRIHTAAATGIPPTAPMANSVLSLSSGNVTRSTQPTESEPSHTATAVLRHRRCNRRRRSPTR